MIRVKVMNRTAKRVLADRAILAKTWMERMVGLLGKKRLEDGEGLVIEDCSAIHTFLMKFPIDVLFLDEEMKVIATLSHLKPFRIAIRRKGRVVVELPSGKIEESKTKMGDMVEII
jgi:hypothetical protein